ncbi:MAG: mechanosensitive ion channel [Ruminococcaceae bacterium]|nr:mechanosensitive ion channel [Oscillospiraceae bacterium]
MLSPRPILLSAEGTTEQVTEAVTEAVAEAGAAGYLDAILAWLSPEHLIPLCISIAGKILACLLILVIGNLLIKLLLKFFPNGKKFDKMDRTVRVFLHHLIKIALNILLIVSIVAIIGVPMASVITVIASAGAAIALALQGSLSNLAGGFMLLLFRPFRIDDFIETQGVSGTVIDVGFFYTTIRTGDNKHIMLPNGGLTNSTVINYSREENRRVDIDFSIAYESDCDKAIKIINDIITAHELVLNDPAHFVRMTEMTDSAVKITARAWCKNSDYWTVKFDIGDKVKASFAQNGISIPYPQMDVHIKDNK